MEPTDPPRPTGNIALIESLDGMLLLAEGRPPRIAPIVIHNGPVAVAVFSTLETLTRFRIEFPDLGNGRIVKIDDTDMFFEDVPPGVVIALDIHKTKSGTVKYLDLENLRR